MSASITITLTREEAFALKWLTTGLGPFINRSVPSNQRARVRSLLGGINDKLPPLAELEHMMQEEARREAEGGGA